MTETFWTPFG